MFEQINPLAVLVCVIVNMVLGAFWYGFLFAKPWMRLMNINPQRKINGAAKKREKIGYAVSTVTSLIMALTLAFVIQFTGLRSLGGGFIVGFVCWLGFCLPTMLPNNIFSEKPYSLAAINIGYPLISMVCMGLILGAWSVPL